MLTILFFVLVFLDQIRLFSYDNFLKPSTGAPQSRYPLGHKYGHGLLQTNWFLLMITPPPQRVFQFESQA